MADPAVGSARPALRRESPWFDAGILPVERLLYQSDLVLAGLWRCRPDLPWFRDSGPARNHSFVFPRSAVRIRRKTGSAILADATIATLYNRGDEYKREAVACCGDNSDWFAVQPAVLEEALHYCSLPGSAQRPFAVTHVVANARACLVQRRLVSRLIDTRDLDPLEVDETVLNLVDLLFTESTNYSDAIAERHLKLIECARAVVAVRFTEQLRIVDLARECQVSPWFLARVFRRVTGKTIHRYQQQLRLRASLDRVLQGEDLTAVALELGFSSHSHFTESFRRAFGTTPTAFKRGAMEHTRI